MIKRSYILFYVLLLSLLPLYSSTKAQDTINIPIATLQTLEQNNNEALSLIQKSKIELNEAKDLTRKQEQLLEKQAIELNEAKTYSNELNNSLKKTEEYLNNYIKKTEHERRVVERQRNLYVLASIVLGYYVLKG